MLVLQRVNHSGGVHHIQIGYLAQCSDFNKNSIECHIR